jgi:hypothetical protein
MKKKLIYGLMGLLLCFGVIYGGSYLYMHPINVKSVLAAHHLLPEPERLTELYFEDHQNLGKTFTDLHSYSFSFTIHNLEYKDFTYEYEVRSIDEFGFSLLDKNSITLKHDEYRTIPISFKTLVVKTNRFEVEVNILNKKQAIHFWMEVEEKKT